MSLLEIACATVAAGLAAVLMLYATFALYDVVVMLVTAELGRRRR